MEADIRQQHVTNITLVRNILRNNNIVYVPLRGKVPILPDWQKINHSKESIDMIEKVFDNHIIYFLARQEYKLQKWNLEFNENNERMYLNVGILTGKENGLVVIDVDIKKDNNEKDGMKSWKELTEGITNINTFWSQTGSGGLHLFFLYDEKSSSLGNRNGVGPYSGIDIRSDGGQIVSFFSMHTSGKVYGTQFGVYNKPNETIDINNFTKYITSIPEELVSKLQPRKTKSKRKSDIDNNGKEYADQKIYAHTNLSDYLVNNALLLIPNEEKNLFKFDQVKDGKFIYLKNISGYHCTICDRFHDRQNPYLYIINQSVYFECRQRGDNEKARFLGCVENNFQMDTSIVIDLLLMGELGPAEIFVYHMKNYVKFIDTKSKACFYFDLNTKLWLETNRENFSNMLIPNSLSIIYDCYIKHQKNLENSDQKDNKKNISDQLLAKKKKLYYNSTCQNIGKFAAARLIDINFISKLDYNLYDIPIVNGKMLNLKDLNIYDRTYINYCSKEFPYSYDCNIDVTEVTKFFKDVMGDSMEMVQFLRTFFGYSLTSSVAQKFMTIFYGNRGDNGKSTLINLVKNVFGPFFSTIHRSVLIKDKSKHSGNTASPYIMALRGITLASLAETEEGDELQESTIKSVLGGDFITGRDLYGPSVTFRLCFKSVVLTNNKPKVVFQPSMTEKIKLVDFPVQFTNNPTEPYQKMKVVNFEERKNSIDFRIAMMKFFVEGAREYFSSGETIIYPNKILDATKQYFYEQDSIGQFLDEYENTSTMESSKANNMIKTSDLYDNYKLFCINEGHVQTAKSQKKFNEMITDRGIVYIRSNGSWFKLKLKQSLNNM